jgi:hypothetical protein
LDCASNRNCGGIPPRSAQSGRWANAAASARFGSTLPGNPSELESALIAGGRAEASDDWSALEALDPRLAQPAHEHPLFADAVRLRVAWRLSETGGPRAREAVALSDPLVDVTGSPRDLVLRARAVAATGLEL